jgi:4-hydroxybenzoate polyprenyltransferase/phosphoserine phosphatase
LAQISISSKSRGARQLRFREVSRTALADEVATSSVAAARAAPTTEQRPLVVDLDGTLVRSDLLIETAFSELGRRPHSLVDMMSALLRGKAALKHRLSEPVDFDPATLPYDDEVITRIRQASADGRPVYLASASNTRLVEAIAKHLGLFTGWFASDETTNLAGHVKAQRLVEAFGERGFDYIGNDAADLPVWARAERAIAIRAPASVARKLIQADVEVEHLQHERPTWRTWAKLIRVHQYAKNALVFLPLIAAHRFEWDALGQAALAAVAFCLCASSVYVLNDLVDLQEDRKHRSKRHRPLASGAVPLLHGLLAVPILFMAAVVVGSQVSLAFLGVLLGYFAITTAYSFVLKRKMLIDVLTLATLYSVRVFGGAVAIEVVVSKWLLAFCMSLFVSLALMKRYVELAARFDAKMPDPVNRDYRTGDLEVVSALAAAAGFNAVTVLALYISSDTVHHLYSRPEVLWLVCPVLIYWIGRALMLAHRRMMDDDPVIFALKDRASLITMVVAMAIIAVAL